MDSSSPRARLAVFAVLGVSLVVFALHLLVLRPYLWPAGAGVTLSESTTFASLAAPRAVPRTRPPDVKSLMGTPVVVEAVDRTSEAWHRGLRPGAVVARLSDIGPKGTDLSGGLPRDPELVLEIWRTAYQLGPTSAVSITTAGASANSFVLLRRPVWEADATTRRAWMRTHLSPLVQMAAFLAGAVVLIALGARGMTATLMTLALVATAIANGGPLLGAERAVPLVGEIVLVFGWLATPLAFPIIGLAVLYFPTRAPILDRYPWIYAALMALAAPMLAVSLLSAAFLLGIDAARPLLGWFAAHGWTFEASFALALAANLLIVVEGVDRFRHTIDANERRRIQIVVFTGVPAVFAYAIKIGVPLLSSFAGRTVELPWPIELILQVIILLPAFGLPYAVAVRRVFSPRTVLRRSLQYALARRTLSVVALLPIAALLFSLLYDNRPLADILSGEPLFYAGGLALAITAIRYRDKAQRWLDRQFFRTEYDGREILVSLASRIPFETDPRELVAMVITQVDSAVQPESITVLAGEGERLEVISGVRSNLTPLARDGGLATLLRWSDEPFEVFLDDERSPVARLPASDRAWLETHQVALLVPVLAGTGDARALIGVLVLGAKRSEEPYTGEDRRLLSGIAAQMSVALDLSRLRRRASGSFTVISPTDTSTPTRLAPRDAAAGLTVGMCPHCHRCVEITGEGRCPDDDIDLQPLPGIPPIIDGKYRIDAMVGRGGMGAVFRARDVRLERDVAIKVIRADMVSDPESRARFRREAQIVARLQHPAIVTVFDYGNLADGAAFIVMEFVNGEDLRSVLKREHTIEQARAVDLIGGVALGVEAAHQSGVLHRDLKPENILLPAKGSGPKVLDFGVAKITDHRVGDAAGMMTHGATIIGTPAYMAPEQLRGEPLDQRADVYSLAVVTFEALTGVLPFGAGTFFDVGARQVHGPALADLGRMPAPLAAVISRALSLERDLRPATARALAEELRLATTTVSRSPLPPA